VLTYFIIGAIIGIMTGVPIGPANVAVIDSAYRHNLLRALAVAFGAALGDALYALLGILGVGPLLARYPGVPPVLYTVSGIVLVVYGILTVRSQPVKAVPPAKQVDQVTDGQHMLAGFALGIALIFMNPAAIVTWVVIVGSYMSGVTEVEGLSAVIGVGAGSLAWFTGVAYLADHGKRVLGEKAIWITRVVGVLLVGYGVFSLGRGVYYFIH
jgi:threonine/homoserine/homoserine lactone efflux protein